MTWKGIVGRGMTPDEFQEYVSSLSFAAWTPDFVVLHNTQDPTFAEWHDVSGVRRMHGLAAFFRDERGWSGGPHVFVADDLIWPFTPLTVPGVHSPSWNAVSWGVEMVGDYGTVLDEVLSPEVFNNTVAVLVTLHAAINRSADTLRFHREDPLAEGPHLRCPGHNVVKSEIVAALAAGLGL